MRLLHVNVYNTYIDSVGDSRLVSPFLKSESAMAFAAAVVINYFCRRCYICLPRHFSFAVLRSWEPWERLAGEHPILDLRPPLFSDAASRLR